MSRTPLDAALHYAELGYRVFPLAPGSKEPLAGSRRCLDATSDPKTISSWWAEDSTRNVGISTDRLFVVDVDPMKDGSENKWPETVPDSIEPGAVSITPRGGRHWWFKQNGVPLRNTASKIADRVDTRADGGYVVVPPSRTENGVYRWNEDIPLPPAGNLPVIPKWLEAAITRPATSTTAAPTTSTATLPASGDDVVERARKYISAIPGAVAGSGGHGTTYRVACHLVKGFALPEETAFGLLADWNATCIPPWSEKELRHKIESASQSRLPAGYLMTDRQPAFQNATLQQQQAPQRIQTAEERFPLVDGAGLDAMDCRVDYLVCNFLVAGQPCIVAGPKKALKTGLLIDMAVSIASGTLCLNTFHVPSARRVLLMTGESGEATVQETARRISDAKGVNLSDLDKLLIAFNLPQLVDQMDLVRLEELFVTNNIDVVVIDPAYLAFSGLEDAGNLFQVGKLLWGLTELGQRTGVTIVIAHHTKKNLAAPYAQPELGDIAWSGFPEWARQWVLLNRREPYDPESGGVHHLWLSVGGSAGHGGAWALDISEGRRTDIGGRFWSVALGSAREEKESRDDDRANAKIDRKERQRQAQLEADAEKLWQAIQPYPKGETAKTLRERAGLSGTRSGPALALLEERGDIEPAEIEKGGKTYDGYKPTTTGTGT